MSHDALNVTELAPRLALALVGLAMFLAFVRLVRGPTLPDRVVALDLMGVLAVGMLAVYAVATDQPKKALAWSLSAVQAAVGLSPEAEPW